MDAQTILTKARRSQAIAEAEAKAKRLAAEESRLATIEADPEKSDLLKEAQQKVEAAAQAFDQAAALIPEPEQDNTRAIPATEGESPTINPS